MCRREPVANEEVLFLASVNNVNWMFKIRRANTYRPRIDSPSGSVSVAKEATEAIIVFRVFAIGTDCAPAWFVSNNGCTLRTRRVCVVSTCSGPWRKPRDGYRPG